MAPAEDDISIEEKRVYAGTAGRTDAYVASDVGLVRVAISDDLVGEFELASRDPARDVAVLPNAIPHGQRSERADGSERTTGLASHDLLAVVTDDDLTVALLGAGSATDDDELTFVDVGVGPSVAVGIHDGRFLVAGADGTVSRVSVSVAGVRSRESPQLTAADVTVARIGEVPDPRSIDGPLIAAVDGVHRVVSRGGSDAVDAVGLDDVRDVAGSGIPLAATSDGLYWLGNGWMDALGGSFDVVAADGSGHAMAGGDGTLWVHAGNPVGDEATGSDEWSTDAWSRADLPVDAPIAALGYGPGLSVAVTETGAVCVDVGDGWRHRTVGVAGVSGVAVTRGGD